MDAYHEERSELYPSELTPFIHACIIFSSIVEADILPAPRVWKRSRDVIDYIPCSIIGWSGWSTGNVLRAGRRYTTELLSGAPSANPPGGAVTCSVVPLICENGHDNHYSNCNFFFFYVFPTFETTKIKKMAGCTLSAYPDCANHILGHIPG